jgi:prophage DNA circulation protein
MAELSYDDVRRASQDSLRDVQNTVYNLKTNSDDMRRSLQQMSNGPTQLNDFNQKLIALQTQVANLDTLIRNYSSSLYALQSLQQGLVDVQRRLIAMEEFVQFTYRYIAAQQEEQKQRQNGY